MHDSKSIRRICWQVNVKPSLFSHKQLTFPLKSSVHTGPSAHFVLLIQFVLSCLYLPKVQLQRQRSYVWRSRKLHLTSSHNYINNFLQGKAKFWYHWWCTPCTCRSPHASMDFEGGFITLEQRGRRALLSARVLRCFIR